MKKNTLLALSLLFTILLSLFACRKSIEFYVDGKEAPASTLLEAAQIWRAQHLDNKRPKHLTLRAHWNDSWTVTASNGDEIVVVPAPERKVTNKDITIRRFIIFIGKGNVVSNGNIVEFVAEKSDVTEQLNDLLPSIHQESVPNFNGFMSSYDINYRFLHSSSYKNGAKVRVESKIATASRAIALATSFTSTFKNTNRRVSYIGGKTSSIPSNGVNCEPIMPITVNFPQQICADALVTWRIDWTKDENGCLTSLFYNYVSHTCPNGAGTGDSGSGEGSGSGSGSGEEDSSGSGSSGYTGGGNPPYGGPTADCNGVLDGSAYNTCCGCIGGDTGIASCPIDGDSPNIAPIVSVSQVSPSSKAISTLTADDWGATCPESVDLEIGASLSDCVWRAVLIRVKGNYSVQTRLKPGRSEVGGTNASNYCAQVRDLKALGGTQWYMISAVQAHENVHVSKTKPSLESCRSIIQAYINTLTVPNTGQSKATAISQLEALPNFNAIKISAYELWFAEGRVLADADHSAGGACDIAERAVVDPVGTAICISASTKIPAWPACTYCPY